MRLTARVAPDADKELLFYYQWLIWVIIVISNFSTPERFKVVRGDF